MNDVIEKTRRLFGAAKIPRAGHKKERGRQCCYDDISADFVGQVAQAAAEMIPLTHFVKQEPNGIPQFVINGVNQRSLEVKIDPTNAHTIGQ